MKEFEDISNDELWQEIAPCHPPHWHCEMFTRTELVGMVRDARSGRLKPLELAPADPQEKAQPWDHDREAIREWLAKRSGNVTSDARTANIPEQRIQGGFRKR